MAERRSEPRVFHGWKLVGALSVVLFFAAAGLFSTVLLTALIPTRRHHPQFVSEG